MQYCQKKSVILAVYRDCGANTNQNNIILCLNQIILSLYPSCSCTMPKLRDLLTIKSENNQISDLYAIVCSVCYSTMYTVHSKKRKKRIYICIYIFSTSTLNSSQSYQHVKPYHAQYCLLGCLISCLSLYNQLKYLHIEQIFYTS